MEQDPLWLADSRSASRDIPSLSWNPEGSLQCSQQPATGAHHEPDESNPHVHNLFL